MRVEARWLVSLTGRLKKCSLPCIAQHGFQKGWGVNYTQFVITCLLLMHRLYISVQENTLLTWTMPSDHVWTKGLHAAKS